MGIEVITEVFHVPPFQPWAYTMSPPNPLFFTVIWSLDHGASSWFLVTAQTMNMAPGGNRTTDVYIASDCNIDMDVQKGSMVNTGHSNTDPGCSMTLDLDMVLN